MPTSTEPANTHNRITTHMPIAEDRQHPRTPGHDPPSRKLGRRAEETMYGATPKPIGMIKSNRMTRSCQTDRAHEALEPIGTKRTNEGQGLVARHGNSRHPGRFARERAIEGRVGSTVDRRRTESAGESGRTDKAIDVPRPPPQHCPGGGGGGSPTRPPLKSLTDFIAVAPTDIGLSEMRTCAGFADGVRAKCLKMVVTCRWGRGASPQPPKASKPMNKTTTRPPRRRRRTNDKAHRQVSRRRLISQIRYGIYITYGYLFILYIVKATMKF